MERERQLATIPGLLDFEVGASFSSFLNYAERQRLKAGEYVAILRLAAQRTQKRSRLMVWCGGGLIALLTTLSVAAVVLDLASPSGPSDRPYAPLANLWYLPLHGWMCYLGMRLYRRRARLLEVIAAHAERDNMPPLDVVGRYRADIIAQVEREERR